MSACPLVDCHTHTSFSDGHASFEDNVRAAAAAGCRVMVSTDHLTLPASMDSNCEVQVVEGDLPAHRLAFEDARKLAARIAPELELIYGFECDWYEDCEPLVERWSEGAVVRLGSVHWIGNPGDIAAGAAGAAGAEDVARPDTPDSSCGWIDDDTNLHVWENLGVRGVWERYVDDWCRACESSLNFDVMAHPDLVMRFSKEGFAPDFDPAPFWEQMAECAHDTGRRAEVSTAALRKAWTITIPRPAVAPLRPRRGADYFWLGRTPRLRYLLEHPRGPGPRLRLRLSNLRHPPPHRRMGAHAPRLRLVVGDTLHK